MSKPELLVIDDEEGFRMFLRDVLEDAGYAVSCASDAESGLGLVKARRFNLVITDMGLPDLNGTAVIARLRLFGCQVPIVAITGMRDGDACLAVAEAYGADRVLYKPFGPKEILTMVQGLMGETLATMGGYASPRNGRTGS